MKEQVHNLPVKAPINLEHKGEYSFYVSEVPVYSIQVYHHSNVYVTNSGVCFDGLARLLPGSFMFEKRIRADQKKIALFNFLFRKRYRLPKAKKYLVVHNQWSINGYYHWLIDSIPRLWRLREELSNISLLLPEKAKSVPFIQDTLELFPSLQVEYSPARTVAYVRQLILPSHLPDWGIFDPVYLKSFKEFVLQKINSQSNDELIYVSREKASRRKVVNEPAIITTLKPFGFKVVVLENHSLLQQAEIFNRARIIISIHGAGLSNLIFMQSHASIIEIIKKPSGSEKYLMEYQRLASIFHVNYYLLPCSSTKSDASFDESDLIVDEKELTNILSELV